MSLLDRLLHEDDYRPLHMIYDFGHPAVRDKRELRDNPNHPLTAHIGETVKFNHGGKSHMGTLRGFHVNHDGETEAHVHHGTMGLVKLHPTQVRINTKGFPLHGQKFPKKPR